MLIVAFAGTVKELKNKLKADKMYQCDLTNYPDCGSCEKLILKECDGK